MNKSLVAFSIITLLAACGGDGSSSNSSSTDPIDKYLGTWKNSCSSPGSIEDVTATANAGQVKYAYVIEKVTLSKLSGSTANLELRTDVYGANDSTCTGVSFGYIIKTGQSTNSWSQGASGVTSSFGQNRLSFVESGTLSDGKNVDKFDIATSNLTSSSMTITAGSPQFKLYSSDFTAEQSKLVIYTQSTGGLVLESDTTFPTAVQPTPENTFTKQ